MKEQLLELYQDWIQTAQERSENDGSGGPVEEAEAFAEADTYYQCAGQIKSIIDAL